MKFEPGHKKVGGRKKGSSNKITGTLLERCEVAKIDPWDEMLKIASDASSPNHFQALKELLQYLYPKRRAVENSSPEDSTIQVIIQDYMSRSEEELIEVARKELADYDQEHLRTARSHKGPTLK
jgi:hypothetical protein